MKRTEYGNVPDCALALVDSAGVVYEICGEPFREDGMLLVDTFCPWNGVAMPLYLAWEPVMLHPANERSREFLAPWVRP